ncbi:T9SS type B sorting domain-containing protein, partial [Psychroflexus maritimus]
FSVDGGPWVAQDGQSSLIFSGLEAGEVEVIGRDLGGCATETKLVSLIDYPKFFTPNEDGFNDSWNIIGLANQSNAKIYI